MLLHFSTTNYKSFHEEMNFSMVPAKRQSGLDFSIQKTKIKDKEYKALSTSVVYGPNAAGKTNVIGAMEALKNIVLRGDIENDDDLHSPNTSSYALELIPNNKLTSPSPVAFSIEFIHEGLRFSYSLKADLGVFLDITHSRSILSESLYVNDEMVFDRNDTLQLGNVNKFKKHLINGYLNNANSAYILASSNLSDTKLFLQNGFRNLISAELASMVEEWFRDKFLVIYRADQIEFARLYKDVDQQSVYVEKTINQAAEIFGINSNAIGYAAEDEGQPSKLCSVFNLDNSSKVTGIPAEIFESYGTIRFAKLFPVILRAFTEGATLVIDEFDASIHPMALLNIVTIFHNDTININGAQLIFNTHNPVFLNSNIFRRDEIKFVERDEENHFSTLYSLSDFGTSGSDGVRKGEDYMRNYFVSKYGAIQEIDFSPVFEELMKEESEIET